MPLPLSGVSTAPIVWGPPKAFPYVKTKKEDKLEKEALAKDRAAPPDPPEAPGPLGPYL